jgi:Heterokaryon incompatibility protein (HET)
MSCSPCQELYLGHIYVLPHGAGRESAAGIRSHHADIASLCRAALSGCRICIDLWRYFFKEKTPEEYVDQPYFEGQRSMQLYLHSGTSYRFLEPGPGLVGEAPKPDSLILEFILNSPMIKGVETKKFVFEKVDDYKKLLKYDEKIQLSQTNSGYMNMLNITPKALEAKRWDRVRTWIHICSSSHSICRLRHCSPRPRFFPTRVIHIPFGPVEQNPRYHLIDSRTQSPTSLGLQYITLSHRWGTPKDPIYRTTAQNIVQRLNEGIYRNELPQTFTDAIDTTLRLRIPFLWIDSLCIIQGDSDDWKVECSKMADVYMNSFLNISATSATSSQEGLSSSYEIHPRLVKTSWDNGRDGKYRLIDPDFWRERVTDAQVNTRGWVLQERVLAPRVLHFGFDQLLWECSELSASEEFPEGMPTEYVGDYVRGQLDFKQTTNLFLPLSQMATSGHPADGKYRKFHDIWQRLGTMYGRCELTNPDTDKFMAISGLARVIQRELDDQYITGLWRKNLLGDLLWRIHKTQRKIQGTVPDGFYERRWDYSKRSTTFRAPSWSWASVDGLVQMGSYVNLSGIPEIIEEGDSAFIKTTRPMASILEVSSSLVSPEDLFGQVDGGRLVLWGQMHKLGTSNQFYEPVMTFRGTREMAFDHIDEPISWDLYEQAYFLPLIKTEKRFMKLTQSLVAVNKEAKELQSSMRATEVYTQTMKEDSESISFPEFQPGREDLYDMVAGIELVPTPDRKAWRRIGYMEPQIQRFRALGGCMSLEELTLENQITKLDYVCDPDSAATQGNIVTGIFEIV